MNVHSHRGQPCPDLGSLRFLFFGVTCSRSYPLNPSSHRASQKSESWSDFSPNLEKAQFLGELAHLLATLTSVRLLRAWSFTASFFGKTDGWNNFLSRGIVRLT